MKTLVRIIVPVLALVIGVVIGASNTTATAEPVVKTKTVTETVEVETTPQSCLDAIDAAEGIGEQATKFAETSVAWPGLVQRAAMAGVDMDVAAIEGITAEVKDITADYQANTADLRPLVRQFNTAKAVCRAQG